MKVTAYRWLVCLVTLLAVGNPSFAQAPAARPAAPPRSAQAPSPAGQPASHGPAGGAQPRPADRGWWHRDDFQKEVGVTNEQIVRMDHIWEEALPHWTEEANQLDEREARLSRLIQMNAEDDRIASQIDRVEAARSLLNKDRQLLLIHMRQVLTPDQRVKFSQRWARLREQAQQPQRQGGPGAANRPPQAPGGVQRSTQPPASSATPAKRPE
jgi:Spy/CpxP family protein refolding chaperone